MPVTVVIAGAQASASAADAAFADFRLLDRTFSPFLPESAVSRMKSGALSLEEAPALVRRAAELCRLYETATNGFFSAWRNGGFDPSGLVKGWAIDRSAAILSKAGWRDFLVDAGGDVEARGSGDAGDGWRVGVRHPRMREQVACVVLARDLAVATSGTYEKGEHIVDPHTGQPALRWLSFTVAGPDILSADVYATGCCAMGEDALDFIRKQDGYEAFGIGRDLSGVWTPGFEALCSVPPRPR